MTDSDFEAGLRVCLVLFCTCNRLGAVRVLRLLDCSDASRLFTQARLSKHNEYFNDLVKVIPAKYYLPVSEAQQSESWVCCIGEEDGSSF